MRRRCQSARPTALAGDTCWFGRLQQTLILKGYLAVRLWQCELPILHTHAFAIDGAISSRNEHSPSIARDRLDVRVVLDLQHV